MTDHYDVIVIGSGAGGGTLTHALAPTGKRILLLERGDFLPREPQNWDSKSVWVDLRYHNSGKWTDADTGEEFPPKQNYYVGGNTKVYGAILFRFRERDFGEIQHVDGISPAWPLVLRRFRALVHPRGASVPRPWPAWRRPGRAAVGGPVPVPAAESRAAHRSAGGRPRRSWPAPVPAARGAHLRRVSAAVLALHPLCHLRRVSVPGQREGRLPRSCAWNRRCGYPNVTLRTRARVTRLETDERGRAVTRVVAERDGQTETYSADLVVVSAGAINSAALLLASASERHPDGLGNGSGVVGRHLMMHNNSSLIAFSKIPNPTKFQKTLGVNDFYAGDPADGGDVALSAGRAADARQERRRAHRLRRARGRAIPRSWPGTRWTSG